MNAQDEQTLKAMETYGGAGTKPTIGAIVDGITYASHTTEQSPYDMLDMESFAGSLLYAEADAWRGFLKTGLKGEKEKVVVR